MNKKGATRVMMKVIQEYQLECHVLQLSPTPISYMCDPTMDLPRRIVFFCTTRCAPYSRCVVFAIKHVFSPATPNYFTPVIRCH